MILCSNVEKKLKKQNMQLINKIHNSGLESIKKGSLKNEQILDFINMDFYFLDNQYASKYYRPFTIVHGLDIFVVGALIKIKEGEMKLIYRWIMKRKMN
jgi:hypothetical protein